MSLAPCLTIHRYWLVPRLTLKNNATQLCNVARGPIFQCWSRLTINICFVISRNKYNKFVSSSMTQQHRIHIHLPNTSVGPKKLTQMHGVTWFTPWITWCHVPREHDTALTKPGDIVYFCTSRVAHWTNHDGLFRLWYNKQKLLLADNLTSP